MKHITHFQIFIPLLLVTSTQTFGIKNFEWSVDSLRLSQQLSTIRTEIQYAGQDHLTEISPILSSLDKIGNAVSVERAITETEGLIHDCLCQSDSDTPKLLESKTKSVAMTRRFHNDLSWEYGYKLRMLKERPGVKILRSYLPDKVPTAVSFLATISSFGIYQALVDYTAHIEYEIIPNLSKALSFSQQLLSILKLNQVFQTSDLNQKTNVLELKSQVPETVLDGGMRADFLQPTPEAGLPHQHLRDQSRLTTAWSVDSLQPTPEAGLSPQHLRDQSRLTTAGSVDNLQSPRRVGLSPQHLRDQSRLTTAGSVDNLQSPRRVGLSPQHLRDESELTSVQRDDSNGLEEKMHLLQPPSVTGAEDEDKASEESAPPSLKRDEQAAIEKEIDGLDGNELLKLGLNYCNGSGGKPKDEQRALMILDEAIKFNHSGAALQAFIIADRLGDRRRAIQYAIIARRLGARVDWAGIRADHYYEYIQAQHRRSGSNFSEV